MGNSGYTCVCLCMKRNLYLYMKSKDSVNSTSHGSTRAYPVRINKNKLKNNWLRGGAWHNARINPSSPHAIPMERGSNRPSPQLAQSNLHSTTHKITLHNAYQAHHWCTSNSLRLAASDSPPTDLRATTQGLEENK